MGAIDNSNIPASGVRKETRANVVIGAGTVHFGLKYNPEDVPAVGTPGDADYEPAVTKGWNARESLAFATGDGNTFKIEQDLYDIEPDGAKVKVKGMISKIGETATITASPIEITAEVMKKSAFLREGTQTDGAVEGYDLFVSRDIIRDNDYVKDLGLIGRTADGRLFVIIFDWAYCSSGLELALKNKDKTMPSLEFECVQDFDGNHNVLPYKIYVQQGDDFEQVDPSDLPTA